jgi:hypothetical protein
LSGRPRVELSAKFCGRMTGHPEVGTAKPLTIQRLRLVPKDCNSTCARWHNLFVADVNIDDNAILRLRICGHAACRAVFTICVSCDRGQRYCSPECRSEVRRRQRHDANCRYQQSELGRDSHRRCQQHYRERTSQPSVTDQRYRDSHLAVAPSEGDGMPVRDLRPP